MRKTIKILEQRGWNKPIRIFNRKRYISFLLALVLVVMMTAPTMSMAAQLTVDLGTTSGFAVLAGSTITNTGDTTISGDVGLSPNSVWTVTGITTGGSLHLADAVASEAQDDLVTAYNDAAGREPAKDLTGTDLGGRTLGPGVYSFSSIAQLTDVLTLDAGGDPGAVFIFQIGSTLTTASNSMVELINEAQFSRIFWQVGSSATLGTDSHFAGHLLAVDSITATTGAAVQGNLLARNGAVTLDNNIITNETYDDTPTPPVTTPEDSAGSSTATGGSDGNNWMHENDEDDIPASLDSATDINVRTITSQIDAYRVTIQWGDMTFRYDFGIWNPYDHSWSGGSGWNASDFDGTKDQVKVINHSNQPINAAFSYEADTADGGATIGSFTKAAGNLNGETTDIMTIPACPDGADDLTAPSDNTYLNLRNAPASTGSTVKKIGAVTVTIYP